MEYPRLMYKSADEYVQVLSDTDRHQKAGEGWFESVPEAIAGVANKAESHTPTAKRGKDGK